MDNLASHKVEGVRERIDAAGAELWYVGAGPLDCMRGRSIRRRW